MFFEWLSTQPGYKSKISRTVIEHLSLPRKEVRIAIQQDKRKVPSLEEGIKVIESIEIINDVDRRDRAMLSYGLVTGARISAVISLPLKAFDENTLTIDQNPKYGVKTKFSKRIPTTFFPLYQPAIEYFVDWIKYLKEVKGFGPNDPIFPMTKVENGKQNISYHSTGEVIPSFWKDSNSARKIFQKRFLDAEIPYYNPHSFRHLIVKELMKTGLTEQEKKAASQNFGHENVGTTFGSYGYGDIPEQRQFDIVRKIRFGNKEIDANCTLTEEEARVMAGFYERIKNK